MKQITLEEYKDYLINNYRYEYDNTEYQKLKRKNILENKYKNNYLESIILSKYEFVNKILEISTDNYYGYINIPLENEPNIIYIDLDLIGGYMSDIVVKDSDNNFYSVSLLKKIFGQSFLIEPCKIELIEEFVKEDDFEIVSEIPLYYLYVQCKKEIIDNVRKQFFKNKKRKEKFNKNLI